MKRDDDLRVQPGRIRRGQSQRAKPFITQALAAAERAGGMARRSSAATAKGAYGRGHAASLSATRYLADRSRIAVIKARVVRHGTKRVPLSAHLTYLSRDGVTEDGDPARMFGADSDDVDHKSFAERCEDDRHHFRFIVAPEDATELSDIKAFTRDLMGEAERDLDTRLDWVAVDHWNTEHPHIHVTVRGRTDNGEGPAEMAALLFRSELVLEVDACRAGFDIGFHDLEGIERAAESGLGIGDDRGEPIARDLAFGMFDLVGALEGAIDPAGEFGAGIGRG